MSPTPYARQGRTSSSQLRENLGARRSHETRIPRLLRLLLHAFAILASSAAGAVAMPPNAQAPPSLRVCCYLGHDLETRVGPLHTPVVFANTVEIRELASHAYANRSILSERNGLVYTCAAGTIDVGHVRNAADWAGYLLPLVRAELGTGATRVIHHELGPVELRLGRRDVPPEAREALARGVAMRAAYELAVWHELATLHFPGRYPVFPEQFSAFSPEDLYSDLLGARLGVEAATSALPYDDAVASLLPKTLEDLGAVSATESRRALDLQARRLWNPEAVVPEAALLLERRVPAPESLEPAPAALPEFHACQRTAPTRLRAPDVVSGRNLAELYELVFHVADDQRAQLLGAPAGNAPVVSSDLPLALRHAQLELANDASGSNGLADRALATAPTEERWTRWRRTPLGEYQGLRFLPLKAFGGASVRGELESARTTTGTGLGGGSLIGVEADTVGGDAFILRYAALWAGSERGLVQHLTGVQARAQFVCEHAGTRAWQAPVLAWFQDCKPNGWLGLGATLLQAQHDGTTGRTVIRPAELQIALNLTGNAFDLSYLQHRLVLTLGAGVDSVSGLRDVPAHVAPRGVATLSGVLRSTDAHWELLGHIGARQSMLEFRDTGMEGKLTLLRRFAVRRGEGVGAPLSSYVTLGIEAGGAWWGIPERSIADAIAPLVSAEERASGYLLVPLSLSLERLTF